MATYKLNSVANISSAAVLAREAAHNEDNQNSYNAGWLHGYATALRDVEVQMTAPGAVKCLNVEMQRKLAHILEHIENGAKEYAYCLDDTSRVTNFVEEARALLGELPLENYALSPEVIEYFQAKYAVAHNNVLNAAVALDALEDMVVSAEEFDTAKEKAEKEYQKVSGIETTIAMICCDLDISMPENYREFISVNDTIAEIKMEELPMWAVNRIREQYKAFTELLADATGEGMEDYYENQVDYLEDVCDCIGLTLKGDDGELIP